MCEPGPRLSTLQAIALGALHGPAELLPISSSGHVTLVPGLLGWDYEQLDGELRKSFEVALHAGTAAALLITLRAEVTEVLREMELRRLGLITLSFLPAALAGYVLERPVQRHLGTPPTVAVGLIAGSVAMLIADRQPQLRDNADAGALDALLLGVAQACALVPGVSRNGAALTAARARGFTRTAASLLSRHVALPVIAGATALKAQRLWRSGLPEGHRLPFAAGTAASFLSTLASTWLVREAEPDRSLAPFAAYRIALGTLVLARG